jgi:peptide deformylase
MIATMKEYDGVGLAADQVHESKQIAVLEVDANPRYPDKPSVPLTVLINPTVEPMTEEMEEDWEGCLSIPDLRGRVPRYKSVRVQAWDRNGKELQFVANDFYARVIQHEWDHLNGKVYLDRMRDLSTLAFLVEFARYGLKS